MKVSNTDREVYTDKYISLLLDLITESEKRQCVIVGICLGVNLL